MFVKYFQNVKIESVFKNEEEKLISRITNKALKKLLCYLFELKAKKEKIGIWSLPNYQSPKDFRVTHKN